MSNRIKTGDKELITSVCPYTGVTTYTRPEWTDVIFGTNYSLSITLVGDRILSVRVKGYSTRDVVAESTDFTKKIIEHRWGLKKEFFYIGDFTGITGMTKDARKYYVDYLNNLRQIKAFILCTPSPFIMLAAKLTKRLNLFNFHVTVENDYSSAVKQAAWKAHKELAVPVKSHTSLEASRVPTVSKPPLFSAGTIKRWACAALPALNKQKNVPVSLTRFTREEWNPQFEGYSIKFELINDNIIHKVSTGYLSVEHVGPAFATQERILKACGLSGHPYFLINGIEELTGSSLKARKQYARLFTGWIEKYPELSGLIVYGANRLLRSGLTIAMYTSPVSIIFAESFEEAMAITRRRSPHAPRLLPRIFPGKANRKNTVQHYADELNCFLGNIDWEIEGSDELPGKKSDDHPFKTVYDAISLIKTDIDELFRERETAQAALRESEEVARALLNATSDLALLMQSDGTIIAANHAVTTFLEKNQLALNEKQITDFLPQSAVQEACAHLKAVVDTGAPAHFETRLSNHYYQNTIYPLFNADKRVDRVALYSRDITGIKEAHEQIHGLTQELIKAQENERTRIARDLHDNVAQDLASLIIRSDTLFDDCKEISPDVRQRTKKFSDVLKKTIASIRDLVYDLRPPGLTQMGLVKTIDQYCVEFSNKNNIEIDLYTAGLERLHLHTDTKINLFRILQEALNNVAKHADATLIKVRLLGSHPDMILRIEDDGCGFDPAVRMVTALKEKRMGLKSMEERVNLLCGTLALHSREGSGTRIVVKFPYNQETGCEEENRERFLAQSFPSSSS